MWRRKPLTPEEFVQYARQKLKEPAKCKDEAILSVLNELELSDDPEGIAERVRRAAEEARVKRPPTKIWAEKRALVIGFALVAIIIIGAIAFALMPSERKQKLPFIGGLFGKPTPAPIAVTTLTPTPVPPTPIVSPTPVPPTPTPIPPSPTPIPPSPTPSQPDLVVTVSISPERITAEQPVTFTVVISNQGAGTVDTPFQVGIYTTTIQEGQQPTKDALDLERPLTTARVESLPAGESISEVLEYEGFSDPGSYTICAFVDSSQQITEADEANNISLTVTLEVKSAWAQMSVAKLTHLYAEPISLSGMATGPIVVYQIKLGTTVEVKEGETELDTVKARVEGWVPEGNIDLEAEILINVASEKDEFILGEDPAAGEKADLSPEAAEGYKVELLDPEPKDGLYHVRIEGWMLKDHLSE